MSTFARTELEQIGRKMLCNEYFGASLMDTSVLTLEIKQANNPGFTDFGSGSIIALTSQCLRCKKQVTPCTICSDFCPVDAIETTLDGRPRIGGGCIKCAACVGVCPTNALGCSTRNIQQFKRLALQAVLRVDHLAVTCERTSALLRLESKTDAPDAALESLRLIEEARSTEHLLIVPCLAMIPREIWFSVLNEIGTLKFRELSIFLPPGQCAECPVNAKDSVEDLFGEAIGVAERWSESVVGIITKTENLPQFKKANVRAYLTGQIEADRRGAFTGFFDELKKSWEQTAEAGNQALNEVQIQRERKKSFERTRLSVDLKKHRPTNRSPLAVTTRYALIEALGRTDKHAASVRLLVSTTDEERCTHCGICVDVCPLKVRLFEEASADESSGSTQAAAATQGSPAFLQSTFIASTETPPEASMDTASKEVKADNPAIVIDELYCVACSACIQACPNEACSYTEIDGFAFLREDWEMEKEAELEDKAKDDEKDKKEGAPEQK